MLNSMWTYNINGSIRQSKVFTLKIRDEWLPHTQNYVVKLLRGTFNRIPLVRWPE